jgi:proline iminopeptidase
MAAPTSDGGAVLVVVEHRDLHALAQLALDIKAVGRLDVFEVDAAKGWLQRGDDVHQPVEVVLFVDLDVEHVDAGKLLEQHRLAFHHRLGRQRADVAQAQHRRAVGDDRHQVATAGVLEGVVGVFDNFLAGRGNTGGVGQRQIVLVVMKINKWLVFGGSWGSTLALAYGQAHPERCTGFVLRGVFLCTSAEIDWFLNGIKWFFPKEHAQFVADIPESERDNLLQAYGMRLFGDDPVRGLQAARAWSRYEGSCLHLLPHPEVAEQFASDAVALGVGRLEAHYFQNAAFLSDDQLIRHVGRIRHLPAVIIQGRYDVVCPALSAWRLHQAWPEASFQIIEDAGHAAFEPGIANALVAATDRFKRDGSL